MIECAELPSGRGKIEWWIWPPMDEKHCCPSKTDTGLHTYWSITKWHTKNFPSPCGIRQLWGMSLWWRKSWFCVGSYLDIFVDLDHNHLPLMEVTYLKMKQRLPLGQSTLHILKSKFYPLEKKHKLINCKWYLRKTRIWRESELSPQKIQQVSKIGVLKARRKILQLFCGRCKEKVSWHVMWCSSWIKYGRILSAVCI